MEDKDLVKKSLTKNKYDITSHFYCGGKHSNHPSSLYLKNASKATAKADTNLYFSLIITSNKYTSIKPARLGLLEALLWLQ